MLLIRSVYLLYQPGIHRLQSGLQQLPKPNLLLDQACTLCLADHIGRYARLGPLASSTTSSALYQSIAVAEGDGTPEIENDNDASSSLRVLQSCFLPAFVLA